MVSQSISGVANYSAIDPDTSVTKPEHPCFKSVARAPLVGRVRAHDAGQALLPLCRTVSRTQTEHEHHKR